MYPTIELFLIKFKVNSMVVECSLSKEDFKLIQNSSIISWVAIHVHFMPKCLHSELNPEFAKKI